MRRFRQSDVWKFPLTTLWLLADKFDKAEQVMGVTIQVRKIIAGQYDDRTFEGIRTAARRRVEWYGAGLL